MTPPSPADDLPPELTAAEAELIELLEEACALEPEAPGTENTDELEKLEVALRAATQAAERAVELRRQRSAADVEGSGVREFTDAAGRAWRVWAVSPKGRATAKRNSLEQLRPEYQGGWLTFETIDESERRRLPGHPKNWHTLDDAGLQELLARAGRVAPRPRRVESRRRHALRPSRS
jgi:hypothetical protein